MCAVASFLQALAERASMKTWILPLGLLLAGCAHAPQAVTAPAPISSGAPEWLAQNNVASVAIAYIEDGRIAWTAAYGEFC